MPEKTKKKYMHAALLEAKKAYQKQEVPIGCVIVCNDKIISRAYNQTEAKQDPTAHAEMIAIRKAAKKLNSWRLEQCEVYVTVAPCPMCLGALRRARIKKLYHAALDPETVYGKKMGPEFPVEGLLEAEESEKLLKKFFSDLR